METSALPPRPPRTRARWECLPLLHHLTGALPPLPRRRRLVSLHVPQFIKINLTLASLRGESGSGAGARRGGEEEGERRLDWCSQSCHRRTYLMPDLSHLDGILTFSFWMPFIIKHSQNVSKVWKHAILSVLLYPPKSFDRPYSA